MTVMRSFLKTLLRSKQPAEDVPLPAPKLPARLTDTAMKLNSENVGIFFYWLNANSAIRLPESFIDDVLLDLPDIPVASNRAFDTNITLNAKPESLRLNIFMDEVDAPDLRFFGSDAVIAEMRLALGGFAAEIGL